jgi:hypothetical protein
MDIFPRLIHGTLREHYILLFGAASTIAVFTGFLGAWIGARWATRSAIAQLEARNRDALNGSHIRDLANSLETIGLEVERIAEAQRFVAKVLVERRDVLPPLPARRDATETTPH